NGGVKAVPCFVRPPEVVLTRRRWRIAVLCRAYGAVPEVPFRVDQIRPGYRVLPPQRVPAARVARPRSGALPRVGHVLRPALEAQHAALGIGLAGATVAAVVAFALRPLGGGRSVRVHLALLGVAAVIDGIAESAHDAHGLLSLPLARGGGEGGVLDWPLVPRDADRMAPRL